MAGVYPSTTAETTSIPTQSLSLWIEQFFAAPGFQDARTHLLLDICISQVNSSALSSAVPPYFQLSGIGKPHLRVERLCLLSLRVLLFEDDSDRLQCYSIRKWPIPTVQAIEWTS